jgi:hypothetical protein
VSRPAFVSNFSANASPTLRLKDVCAILNVSRWYVRRRLVNEKLLVPLYVGSSREPRFLKRDVEKLLGAPIA